MNLHDLLAVLQLWQRTLHAAINLEMKAQEVEELANELERLHGKAGLDLMSLAQLLHDEAASIAEKSAAAKTAVENAITRLSDNPTAAVLAEVIETLRGAGTNLDSVIGSAGTIDPETEGGVQPDPDNEGEVIPPAEGDGDGGDA